MAGEKVTPRQKSIPRLLKEKRRSQKNKLGTLKKTKPHK